MKMIVVTTITSTLDIDTMTSSHVAGIDDQDGISEVSGDVLGAVLLGALNATRRAVVEAYPRAEQAEDRVNKRTTDDEAGQ